MSPPIGLPRLFLRLATRRGLLLLLALTLASGAAMLPAMRTMADHGASLIAFENAGSVDRAAEILAEWGAAGKRAMWWQLALDLPFLVGYGLFAAAACTAVARRAAAVGKPRLRRAAAVFAWFGPLAAARDLLQNIGLALVLLGRVEQPWPRMAAVGASSVTILVAASLLFALVGAFLTRESAAAAAPAAARADD